MRECWRWFGPADKVGLADARQAGASGIVTALHGRLPGEVWSRDEIAERKRVIAAAGLTWDVVESLPISEAIRTAGPEREAHIAAWCESLESLAAEGLRVICYNFMPVIDWTRTDLAWGTPTGATAMRFDLVDFAAFDIHILARAGAEGDFPAPVRQAAADRAAAMDEDARAHLTRNIVAGLPGSAETLDLGAIRDRLASYADTGDAALRRNYATFLQEVVPVAEKLGMRLCCHPDDPPWPLLGLPRIVSTEADLAAITAMAPSPANGLTFCTGSLGARGDNDLPGMAERLGPHIHFAHLRNVLREDETVPGSFFEDAHLDGSSDMVAIVAALLAEEARRRGEGRDDAVIPMRPDHGQDMLSDLGAGAQPGYPAVGRLRGLAELRGVMRGLQR